LSKMSDLEDFDHVFGIRGEEEFDRVYQRIQLEEQENRPEVVLSLRILVIAHFLLRNSHYEFIIKKEEQYESEAKNKEYLSFSMHKCEQSVFPSNDHHSEKVKNCKESELQILDPKA
ncbi:hypothetical protein L9F63_007030, partial [Diploptera punctata]